MIIKNKALLAEFAQKTQCEFCGRYCAQGTDAHHFWYKRGCGGGSRIDHPYNLISLCRGFYNGHWVSCHEQAEMRKITKEQLLWIVSKRESMDPSAIIAELERIRNLPKGSDITQ